MLIDDVTIKVAAGKGGAGIIAFNKNKQSLGPTGGSGGNGGNILAQGVSDLSALRQFRFKKEAKAEDGQVGQQQFRDGAAAKDIILKMPIGTVIHNLDTGEKCEVVKIDKPVLIAKGGKGGRGNFLFRSSRNTSPKICQPGLQGDRFSIRLELKLIADVGFIGLPNVGKSSLLNELTNAESKVADYCFTTLEPNLGDYYGLILADIPGIISGASSGKGLGIKFLRHIERTKTLFHFISAESEDLIKDYNIIRAELKKHNEELLLKPECIFISKSDLASAGSLKKKAESLKKISNSITVISLYDDQSIKQVEKILNQLKKQKFGI